MQEKIIWIGFAGNIFTGLVNIALGIYSLIGTYKLWDQKRDPATQNPDDIDGGTAIDWCNSVLVFVNGIINFLQGYAAH